MCYSGIAPFPGAETGTGGRLRDVQATGRGAHTLAGICGYCVGNLHMPEHPLPWEIDPTGSVGRDKDRCVVWWWWHADMITILQDAD